MALCGVPQGSVLGPLLFTIFTHILGRLLQSLDVEFHFFAGYAQLHLDIVFSRDAATYVINAVESGLLRIGA